MTLSRGRRRSFVVPASRPRYTWRAFTTQDVVIVAGATAGLSISESLSTYPTFAALGIFGDYTIRRTLMSCILSSGAASSSIEHHGLVVACGILEDDAVAASVFPDPATDPYDWFLYDTLWVQQDTNSVGATSVQARASRKDVGSKSMRKVNENHQQPMLILQALPGNTDAITVSVHGRVLVSHGQR